MVIVEGIDGAGKTSLVNLLKKDGFKDVKYIYDKSKDSFATKYFNIDLSTVRDGVSDRSFISEIAKGILVRGCCRLSDEQFEELLKYYGSLGTIIIYLKAKKEVLLERRKDDIEDYNMISNLYDEIIESYDKAMNRAKKYMKVYEIDTSTLTQEKLLKAINDMRAIEER